MTHSVSNLHEAQTVIVGVDTHKHMHVAGAIDSRGIRLGAHSFGADSEGWVANYYSARTPLRLSSMVILGVVARMFRCATRSSCWCT